jgi:hypothetical protein
MFLPVILVSLAQKSDSDLQLAKKAISPAEHSRKHRQRTGPRLKTAEKFLPVILVEVASSTVSDLQLAKTEMSPMEHSRKHPQQTGPRKKAPRKKSSGKFLPAILVRDALNTESDLQLAKTEMSPAEDSRKHRQRTGSRKKVWECSHR